MNDMIKNLTPDTIRIRADSCDRNPKLHADDIVLFSDGVAGLSENYWAGNYLYYEGEFKTYYKNKHGCDRIFTRSVYFGSPIGLPDPIEGIHCIVSPMILFRYRHIRRDLLALDIGDSAIRDDNGNIFAVTGLIR